MKLTQYLSDDLINTMYEHWRKTSYNTFEHWMGLTSSNHKRTAIARLEVEHPRIWQKIRSSAAIV